MLHDRGYLVTGKELEMSLPEFKVAHEDQLNRSDLTTRVQHKDNPAGRIFFCRFQ
jgi:hypothetical protein